MYGQSERLKKTHKNLKKIENSAVPGIDKLIGLISKANLKNTVILALVIAFCLVILIYSSGFVLLSKELVTGTNSTATPSNETQFNNNSESIEAIIETGDLKN
jgi:hypothetical protein